MLNGSCLTATQVRACSENQYGDDSARGELTYRLRLEGEELIVCLIHRSEVVHGGDEDVDLENISLAASRCLKDGLEVLEGLPL